jgi:hypothetical protein
MLNWLWFNLFGLYMSLKMHVLGLLFIAKLWVQYPDQSCKFRFSLRRLVIPMPRLLAAGYYI